MPVRISGRSDATRLEQILEWAGEDFDGLIVFDEAHALTVPAFGEGEAWVLRHHVIHEIGDGGLQDAQVFHEVGITLRSAVDLAEQCGHLAAHIAVGKRGSAACEPVHLTQVL